MTVNFSENVLINVICHTTKMNISIKKCLIDISDRMKMLYLRNWAFLRHNRIVYF